MTKDEIVKRWLEGSEDAWMTAQSLFESKRFHHCLFFVQLALEKLIKALTYHLLDDHPVSTHNLVLLVQKLNLNISIEMELQLTEISAFNISARYDDIKQALYKKATLEYTKEWMDTTEKLMNYFRSMIK